MPVPPASPALDARRARAERTRARLLDAARSAFTGLGWHRARVEDICRVAEVGHGTFYGHFANKADALEGLVRAHAADLYALLDADWTSGDAAAAVRRVIEGFVACAERDADVRSAWLAAAPSEPVLARLVDEVRSQFVGRIRDHLSAARDAGSARADLDVDVAAAALAAMVEQSVALAHQSADPPERSRLVDGLTDLWVHAVYQR